MIDHGGAKHVYIQVADQIAERIHSGALRPRRPIPSETALMQEFDVSRDTARRAVRYLRDNLRLIYTVPVRGSFVRAEGETDPDVALTPDVPITITSRMPTKVEAAELAIAEDVPVTVVTRGDETELYPAGTLIRIEPIESD